MEAAIFSACCNSSSGMVSDDAITAIVRMPESFSALSRKVLSTPPEKASTTDCISFNKASSFWYLLFIFSYMLPGYRDDSLERIALLLATVLSEIGR